MRKRRDLQLKNLSCERKGSEVRKGKTKHKRDIEEDSMQNRYHKTNQLDNCINI